MAQDSGQPKVDQFEIVRSGSLSGTKAASSTQVTVTYTHNLGYIPAMIAYSNYPGSALYQLAPFTIIDNVSGAVDYAVSFNITSTYLDFIVTTPSARAFYSSTLAVGCKFYLLKETAS